MIGIQNKRKKERKKRKEKKSHKSFVIRYPRIKAPMISGFNCVAVSLL